MASIARARISLRVIGENLEPDEVSALLGQKPSRSHRRGDPVKGDREDAVEPTGAWILDSTLPETADIEEQIEHLLAAVSNDTDEWEQLTAQFSASIQCGLFLDVYNEGFEFSPRVALSLAERGLVTAFDIYSGDPEA